MVEFSLSKKVTPAYGWNDNTEVILAEEVKEFIRLLKADLKLTLNNSTNETEKAVCKEYLKVIDKLAGDKLK